ncbi:GIY-YIG nuclease family protein [Sphingomonas sp.]|jgi:putative endonuclease|uniref:GIY-YIG nuclease family protein n=1 Tax=Sphingomonas sp. TaxID=28214 RepID=UPI00338FA765
MIGAAYVYIMASRRNGTLYLGSTVDLPKRAWEHRTGAVDGFSKRYGCHRLAWYEVHESWEAARQRELQMKEWRRNWKCGRSKGPIPTGTTCTIASHDHDRLPNWTPACAGVVRTERE